MLRELFLCMSFCLIQAHESKLLRCDEPVTIQISQLKQLLCSFHALLLKYVHLMIGVPAHICAVTERDISHQCWQWQNLQTNHALEANSTRHQKHSTLNASAGHVMSDVFLKSKHWSELAFVASSLGHRFQTNHGAHNSARNQTLRHSLVGMCP